MSECRKCGQDENNLSMLCSGAGIGDWHDIESPKTYTAADVQREKLELLGVISYYCKRASSDETYNFVEELIEEIKDSLDYRMLDKLKQRIQSEGE